MPSVPVAAPPGTCPGFPYGLSGWLIFAVFCVALAVWQPQLPLCSVLNLRHRRHDAPPMRRIKMATFNIRYDPAPAHQRENGFWGSEHSWDERKQHVADQVCWEAPDLVGFQEVLHHQLVDLKGLLGSEYDGVGVGRDDGAQRGEAVPIFWKRALFDLVDKPRYFWLSDTPDVPGSVGWDAGQTRMATLISLRSRTSGVSKDEGGGDRRGTVVHAICTHFDDRGKVSRGKAAQVILDQVADLMAKGDLMLLMGDLNSESTEAGYQVLTRHRYDASKMRSRGFGFLDAQQEVHQAGKLTSGARTNYGESGTFTDFKPPVSEPDTIIDFCMVADNAAARDWAVKQVAILPNLFRHKPRLSDHRMTVAVLER